jgi:Family of unknown function (DUF6221)
MSDDGELAAFLAARLDEKEAVASHSGPAHVAWLTYRDDEGRLLYTTVAAADDLGPEVPAGDEESPWSADGHELPSPASARVVYDPARALREVAADRTLLRERERLAHRREALAANRRASEHWTPFTAPGYPTAYDMQREGFALEALEHFLCSMIRVRAAVWSDHRDYRQRWSPHPSIL